MFKSMFGKMLPSAVLSCAALICFIVTAPTANAQWQKLADLGTSFDCGFAIDDQIVLIGSGKGVNNPDIQNVAAQIYKTLDGGANWHLTKSPPGEGAVTSIFLVDQKLGYASVFPSINTVTAVLWKTIDGGENWTDASSSIVFPTCVYATSKAIIVSQWFNYGGSSTDGGRTYSQTLGNPDFPHTNGIDFTDDNIGVATVLQSAVYPSPYYFTRDGGITWQPSSFEKEAWSVYGKKCSQDFFTANEDSVTLGNAIHWSGDGGKTWALRFAFPDPKMHFTGAIGGKLNTLYAQTTVASNLGMFRSDDLGLSWKSIGGPSDNRDTRFVVSGSHGERVFAFDNAGGIWRTTNGGDGTIAGGHFTPGLLSISTDSLVLTGRSCAPDTAKIDASNFGCFGLTIDSAIISPNIAGEFDLNILKPDLQTGESTPIEVHFTPKNAPTHNATIHLYAHSPNGAFDTTIYLTGIDRSTTDPYFGPGLSAKIGDTVDVPIYLHQTNNPFNISSLEVTYVFNSDLLTPVAIVTKNTLLAGATSSFGAGLTRNSSVIDLMLPTPLTQIGIDFTIPLFIVRMRVTLTRASSTDIVLSNFVVNNVAPVVPCSTPSLHFQPILQCGDSTIETKMAGGDIAKLLRIQPNPMQHSFEDVWYYLPADATINLDLIDERGIHANSILSSLSQMAGTYHIQFNSAGVPSGMYFMQLSVGGVPVSVLKILGKQ